MKFVACYLRVSALEKSHLRQKREIGRWLKQHHIGEKSVRWYVDKPHTGNSERQRLQEEIRDDQIRAVVVYSLDRIADTTRDGLTVLMDWCNEALRVVAVHQQIDFEGKDCRLVNSILRGVIEMDQATRRERTKAGVDSARAQGRAGGRPRVEADHATVQKVKKLQKNKAISVSDICQRLRISRSTYYRYIAL